MQEHINQEKTEDYTPKRIGDTNFYEVIKINGEREVFKLTKGPDRDPGIVYLPYTIEERNPNDGPDLHHESFKDWYKSRHALCPKCGTKPHRVTLACYIVNMDKKDDYKDLNSCVCVECGDHHSVHDRVPEK